MTSLEMPWTSLDRHRPVLRRVQRFPSGAALLRFCLICLLCLMGQTLLGEMGTLPAESAPSPLPAPLQTPEPWPSPHLYFDPPTWQDQTRLMIFNPQPYDLSLDLALDPLLNLTTNLPFPRLVTIPGGQRLEVAQLTVADPTLPFNVYVHIQRFRMGPADAKHDSQTVYALPFAPGKRFKLLQGFNGRFSHQPPQLQYALDFDLPEGTPVHAARAGIVAHVIDSYSGFGTHPGFAVLSNLVYIQHADGSFGRYLHLQRGGARVRPGQKVKTGDLLGLSGNTGYSLMPHLHFDVILSLDASDFRSVPIVVRTQETGLKPLKEGQRYTALPLT